MNQLEFLSKWQLEWLEAVKYDELLKAIENHKIKNTIESLKYWDEKETDYLMVVNHIESKTQL